MATNTTYKAVALAQILTQDLALRLSSLTVALGYGTAGDPTVKVGTGSPGDPGAFIRIITEPTIGKDSLGNNQTVYTPHIIQVAFEANPAGGAGADINTWAVLLPVLGETLFKGCKLQVWLETNGTGPSETTFNTGSKLKATYNPHLSFPMVSNS